MSKIDHSDGEAACADDASGASAVANGDPDPRDPGLKVLVCPWTVPSAGTKQFYRLLSRPWSVFLHYTEAPLGREEIFEPSAGNRSFCFHRFQRRVVRHMQFRSAVRPFVGGVPAARRNQTPGAFVYPATGLLIVVLAGRFSISTFFLRGKFPLVDAAR